MTIRILVNDEPREVAARTTVAALLADLSLTHGAVAVAVDGAFVPRSAHAHTELTEGARVEIVAPMAGG